MKKQTIKIGQIHAQVVNIGGKSRSKDTKKEVVAKIYFIAVALKEEFDIIYTRLKEVWGTPQVKRVGGRVYYEYNLKEGFQILIGFMGEMGNHHSQDFINGVLTNYKENIKLIFWVGIGGGSSKLGTVFIPKKITHLTANSKVSDSDDGPSMGHSSEDFNLDKKLLTLVENFQYSHNEFFKKWLTECNDNMLLQVREYFSEKDTQKAKDLEQMLFLNNDSYDLARTMSDDIVVASQEHWERLRRHDRKFNSVDMESAGMAYALMRVEVKYLILRGISDQADEEKKSLENDYGKLIRRIAMYNASCLLINFFEADLFDENF